MSKQIIPNPLHSYEDSLRYRHLDIAELDDLDLWREGMLVDYALSRWPRRDETRLEWLLARRGQIISEQSRRARAYDAR
jgi:hypothetical protein